MSRRSRIKKFVATAMSLWIFLDSTGVVVAMQPLSDVDLSEENGAGLAFPFENFRLQFDPSSFIELTGSVPTGTTTFIRGDYRYYGLTISRGETGGTNTTAGTIWNSNTTTWDGTACSGGFLGMGCPITTDAIQHYSDFDDPFIIRVFNYNGISNAGASGTAGVTDRAVLEILGPSNMDAFRWSFFGEVEAGRTYGATASNGLYPINPVSSNTCNAGTGAICMLQLQNIIIGKPASLLKPPSVAGGVSASNPYYGPNLRFFQFYGTNTAGEPNTAATYGIQYDSRLSGDYRLSVNTSGSTTPTRGTVPPFTTEEGLYFSDVQAFLPLGQLHYQALVFDDSTSGGGTTAGTNGNVSIEITRIPNKSVVYNDFYSSAGAAGVDAGYQRTSRSDRYYQTHGYVEYGTGFPSNGNSNSLGGSGLNTTVRYSYTAADPDGPTGVLNSTNYPASIINTATRPSWVNGPSSYSNGQTSITCGGTTTCTYTGVTIGDVVPASASRSAVIGAGGMVFVSSSSSSTWSVLNNQMAAPNNTLQMIWTENQTATPAANSPWQYVYQAQEDARYRSFNPTLNVNAINLGSTRIDGLLINHMQIKTLEGL